MALNFPSSPTDGQIYTDSTSGNMYAYVAAYSYWKYVSNVSIISAFTSNVVISVTDNTNAALRITQTGNASAFVVEDSTNPDATPFIVDANGQVGVGASPTNYDPLGFPGTKVIAINGTNSGEVDLMHGGTVRGYLYSDNVGINLFTSPQGQNLVFGTLDTEYMRITTNGNVGIGTSNPTELLHLASTGNVRIILEADTDNVNEADSPQILFYQDNRFNKTRVGYRTSSTANDFEITNETLADSANLVLGTGNQTRIHITNVGNVGIATTNPQYRLDVNGSVNVSSILVNGVATIDAAFGRANTANVTADAAFGQANLAFSRANTANITADAAFGQANLAFSRANSALANTSNVAFSGDLRITGNLGIGTTVGPAQQPYRFVVSNGGANGFEIDPVNGIIQTYNRQSGAYTTVRYYASNFDIWTGSPTPARTLYVESTGNVIVGGSATSTIGQGVKLDVAGSVNASSVLVNDNIIFDATTSSTTRIGEPVANTIAFTTSGSERMRIDSTGNVRIGTTATYTTLGASSTDNPILSLATLNKGGGLGISTWSAGTFGPDIQLMRSLGTSVGTHSTVTDATSLGTIRFAGSDSLSVFRQSTLIASTVEGTSGNGFVPGRLEFYTTSQADQAISERMRITSNGDVGIGVTSPEARLHIDSNSSGNTVIIRQRGAGNALYIEDQSSDPSPTVFDSGNRVIVGYPSALATGSSTQIPKVQIHNTSGTFAAQAFGAVSWGINATAGGFIAAKSRGGAVGTHAVLNTNDDIGQIRFMSSNGTQFVLSSYIGAESEGPTSATSVPTRIVFYTTPGNSVTNAERMRVTGNGEVYIAGTTDQGAFNLQVNGTGVWGAGAYTNGSDERIKEDIQPISSSLSVIQNLNPVTFRYKPDWSKDQSIQPGFIAQELRQAMNNQIYIDGVVQKGPEYYSVAYQSLIPLLTKAIQELKAEHDNLKSEFDAYKAAHP